jgi:hypothetical protein
MHWLSTVWITACRNISSRGSRSDYYDNFDIISLAGGVHDYEMVLKYHQLAVQIHNIHGLPD